jgi:protein-S-isoprenylcysteine O-methyltransferase Ste14
MTQMQIIGPDVRRKRVSKFIALLYGLADYVVFFVTKTIDSSPTSSAAEAPTVNLLLMSLFAVQQSLMARRQFKPWWTQHVPKPIERDTYVLFASLSLLLLFSQWRAIPAIVWQIDEPDVAVAVAALSLLGWASAIRCRDHGLDLHWRLRARPGRSVR